MQVGLVKTNYSNKMAIIDTTLLYLEHFHILIICVAQVNIIALMSSDTYNYICVYIVRHREWNHS